jgi:hypothetical protein
MSIEKTEEIDIYSFHEQHAGRLIIDPEYVFIRHCSVIKTNHFYASREARIELGAAIAARLKLSEDGTKVLWPQPTDSALDPQNWTMRRKNLQLFIITLASIVPDFDSGIGERRNFIKPTSCYMGNQVLHPSLRWRRSTIRRPESSSICPQSMSRISISHDNLLTEFQLEHLFVRSVDSVILYFPKTVYRT